MRIVLGAADSDEMREAACWGILGGVMTNPTLMMKNRDASHEAVIREIAETVDEPISAETVSLDTQGMLEEARRFARWHPNVVVKVPSIPDGWAAVRQLKRESIRTNVTLCFSANQALFAALAGAGIISPFVARLDGISEDGMPVMRVIVEIYRKRNLPTLALVASIRHPLHIIEAAKAGVDSASAPFEALEQAARHPLTDQGIENSLEDWETFTAKTREPRQPGRVA